MYSNAITMALDFPEMQLEDQLSVTSSASCSSADDDADRIAKQVHNPLQLPQASALHLSSSFLELAYAVFTQVNEESNSLQGTTDRSRRLSG